MYWKMKEFDIAYEKAELVLKEMNYKKDRMIPTATIIDTVEKMLKVDVRFALYDFTKLSSAMPGKKINLDDYGAAMAVDNNRVNILLNENETPEMQRFSLVHELGHLMTQKEVVTQPYRVSTHIDMDITSIPKEILENPKYKFLVNEQVANIFALLVLMPYEMLVDAMKKQDSFEDVAKFFGVNECALDSRLQLKDAEKVN